MQSQTYISTLFPYTTLFRSSVYGHTKKPATLMGQPTYQHNEPGRIGKIGKGIKTGAGDIGKWVQTKLQNAAKGIKAGTEKISDRKSTRLNSSHTVISYAVFC